MAETAAASSACPICGKNTPHYHDPQTSIADGPLYLERVVRPSFEAAVENLVRTPFGQPARYSQWTTMDRWKRRDESGDYADETIQTLWSLWQSARNATRNEDPRFSLPLQHSTAHV